MSQLLHKELEPLMTITELARKGTVRFSKSKLYELASRGDIPTHPVDGTILVLESEVYHALLHFNSGPRRRNN